MPLTNVELKALIGRKTPVFLVPLERGKIREFAEATASRNAAYVGASDPLVPPTFLTIGPAFWGYSLEQPRGSDFEQLGFDPELMLHAGEEYEFPNGPPRAGQELAAQSEIVDAYSKTSRSGASLLFLVVETTYRNAHSAIVAIGRTTAVRVGTPT